MQRTTVTSSVRDVVFSPCGRYLLGETRDGLVVWDLPALSQRLTLPLPLGRSFTATPLTTSTDGNLLVYDHHILDLSRFWKRLADEDALEPEVSELPGLRFESGTSLAQSRNGRLLVAEGLRGLEVWEVERKRCVRRDPIFGTHFALSPDGRLIAHADPGQNIVEIRHTRRGHTVTWLFHTNVVRQALFSPDGQYLATMTAHPSRVSLWRVNSWQGVSHFRAFSSTGLSMEFSSDGGMLAASSRSGVVRVWNVAQLRELEALDLEIGPVTRVTLAPDGMTAAALGGDQIVVWDLDDD